MRRLLVYQLFQIKRVLKLLPVSVSVSFLFALVSASAAFAGSRLLYQDQAAGRITVAVASEKEDSAGRRALSMLGSMDSVKSICNFMETTVEEAREGVNEGRYYAALFIPPRMTEGIMDGTNTPVKVLLSGKGGLETLLLRQLTESGARILDAAQAGIYAADFYCSEQGVSHLIPQTEQFLNQIYLDTAFHRSGWFRTVYVSALGEMDLWSYYGTTAITLLLFLTGIPCAGFLSREPQALQDKLETEGISAHIQLLVKILAAAVLLFATALILGILASVIFAWMGMEKFQVNGLSLTGAAWSSLVCASVIVCCFEMSGGMLAGSVNLFVWTGAMFFLSGGLLPPAFFPQALRKFSVWLPASAVRGLLGPLYGVRCSRQDVLTALCSFMAFYGLGLWSRKRVRR